ncbi:MAG TPA: FAD-dependent oxidoreductase [Marinagarivorans sp.]
MPSKFSRWRTITMQASVISEFPSLEHTHAPGHTSTVGTTIIVGNGPAGMRVATELLQRERHAKIIIFGSEPYQPYNRVQLSALLAGDVKFEDILTPIPGNADSAFEMIYHAVVAIDPQRKTVLDSHGKTYCYDQLVLATGSNPHIPRIDGVEQAGVYTFRNLKDTESLYNRVNRARHIVVVGGGLLGLEAARALLRSNTQVTIIQQSARLMNRQLDEKAANLLAEAVKTLGIKVICNSGVREVLGDGRVTGVRLRTGESLTCDTVLFCTGIRPEVTLARNAQLKIQNGILVDDKLQTSMPDIYAIGECCEHQGVVYGLVNPGFEQAAVVADVITQGRARYLGSLEVSRLKVVGQTVCSMGEINEQPRRPFVKALKYYNKHNGTYRSIILHKGAIESAVGYGEWPELRRVQEAYQHQRKIFPWQYVRFFLTGRLFVDEDNSVKSWPATTIVCQCNNVSQGQLSDHIAQGCSSVQALQKATSAATVCGSCKPLLQNLLGEKAAFDKDRHSGSLTLASLCALLLVLLFATLPAIPVGESVQQPSFLEFIWNDKFYKQVTGFSILAITLLAMIFSIRKKIHDKKLGDFSHWRLAHALLALIAGTLVYLHTGLHAGENLNFWLLANFLAAFAIGAITASAIALAHKIKPSKAQTLRSQMRWLHILVAWPLPVLVLMHILSVYYF